MTWRSSQASPVLPVWESTVPSVLPHMSPAGDQWDLEVLQLRPGNNSPAGPAPGRAIPAPGAARRDPGMPRLFLAPLSTCSLPPGHYYGLDLPQP